VDDCLWKCNRAYLRCQKRAEQMAPVQSEPGDANSDVPVLSTE
jgi:hypothetical protein